MNSDTWLKEATHDFLVRLAKQGVDGYFVPNGLPPFVKSSLSNGLIEVAENEFETDLLRYRLTEKGIEELRSLKMRAVQITFDDQPPLILKDGDDLAGDIKGGILSGYFECDFVDAPPGTKMFTVSVIEIDEYSFYTLPEWEPN